MNNKQKNEKGFTMVELIIVVAIMAIIGALLVPAFSQMSAKARVTTDLSTIKTLKRTVDNYYASESKYPDAVEDDTLVTAKYLDAKPKLQTADATISYDKDKGTVKLDVSKCDDTIKEQAGKLDADFVIGGKTTTTPPAGGDGSGSGSGADET